MEFIDRIIVPACWTAFCLVGGLASYYCSSRLLLKKRERDEDPSLELDSKKARLDDQGRPSDPSARAEAWACNKSQVKTTRKDRMIDKEDTCSVEERAAKKGDSFQKETNELLENLN